jgi:hypothetical protein
VDPYVLDLTTLTNDMVPSIEGGGVEIYIDMDKKLTLPLQMSLLSYSTRRTKHTHDSKNSNWEREPIHLVDPHNAL